MTEQEILTIMKQKENWSLSYKTNNGQGVLQKMVFSYQPSEEEQHQRFPIPSYCCTIRPDGSFSFSYSPKRGLTTLSTPACSLVTNAEHFEKIQTMFEHQASILAKYE